jgi:hypothetical protein
MAQGFYGGIMGNARALEDLVYRGEPTQMMPMPYYGGGMGIEQLAGGPDLPFGGGGRYKTIQEQNKPGAPRDYIPIRTFPQTEPWSRRSHQCAVPPSTWLPWNAADGQCRSFFK